MTKHEIALQIHVDTGMTLNLAEQAVKIVCQAMRAALAQGERVDIRDFGAFVPVMRQGRACRNFHTGEPVVVAAHKSVKFKPGKALKAELNRT